MAKLDQYGILNAIENWQLDVNQLIDISLKQGLGKQSSTGALAVDTGEFTGRSPKDRFIVKDKITENLVWWDGKVNLPFDEEKFNSLYDRVVEHLSGKELYIRDGFVCSDPNYKQKVRTISETPWASLFVYNMFLRPDEGELEADAPADWLVVNAPSFMGVPDRDGTRQHNFSILNFTRKIVLIGGSGYTGEIKKGIFSALNLTLPVYHNVFPMHCSANVGNAGDTALFFGLSGTGKTTLSADPDRKLIGDDEHGWSPDDVVFNFEGGCYAKVIDITEESEPDIFRAIRKGALLENVVMNEKGEVDYKNASITQNTRVSYPLFHIDNIQELSLGRNPKNIFFLTFDAYGVLPPLSKLDPNQAAYSFISGYTSKVAGTEAGVTEPQTTFSACFGAPFMPLHPAKYADMLSQKMKTSGANVWLINTGLTGTGSRMSLKHTRALISAALNGDLENISYEKDPFFGYMVPTSCPNVPGELLKPENSWADKDEYKRKAMSLVDAFKTNFSKYEEYCTVDILHGGPVAIAP